MENKVSVFIFSAIIIFLLLQKSESATIRITSYDRTVKEQAQILIKHKKQGKNIIAVYKNKELITKIDKEIKKNSKDVLKNVIVIIQNAKDNGIYISKHLCGKAIDISKRGSRRFVTFLRNIDGITLLNEGDHYHLQSDEDC